MNATMFMLVVMFFVPVKGSLPEEMTVVMKNLTEQQCIARRDAVLAKAADENKNVIAACRKQ